MAEVTRYHLRVELNSPEQRVEVEQTMIEVAAGLNAGLTRTTFDWPDGADYMTKKAHKRLRKPGVLA